MTVTANSVPLRTCGRWLFLAAVVMVWLASIQWPVLPDGHLDTSWMVVLAHAWEQHWQHGSDIVFTYGPWGSFAAIGWPLANVDPKLGWELAGKLSGSVVLCCWAWRLPAWRRPWYLLLVVVGQVTIAEGFYLMVAIVLVLELLREDRASTLEAVGGAVLLAGLAEIKFTLFLLSAGGMFLVLGRDLAVRRFGDAVRVGVGFAGGFVLWWMAAGQAPGGIPAYVARSLDVAAGYNGAMEYGEPARVTVLGIAVLLVVAGWLVSRCGRVAAAAGDGWRAVFCLGVVALAWKHAFVRGDPGHLQSFFFLMAWLVSAVAWAENVERWRGWVQPAALSICVLAAIIVHRDRAQLPRQIVNRVLETAAHVVHVREFRRAWAADHETNRREARRILGPAIGPASVDVFNYEQGLVVLAGLNYHPRPTIQGYTAYTGGLAALNRDFYRTATAPDRLLIKYQTIDERFPALDDGWLWIDFAERYAYEKSVAGFLLARRHADRPAERGEEILKTTVTLGETVSVPAGDETPVVARIRARLRPAGRLRSLVYKPPRLNLVVTADDGSEHRYRLVPEMAAAGFVLNPFIADQADLCDYLQGGRIHALRSFRLEAKPGQADYWAPADVVLERRTGPRLHRVDPARRFATQGVSNLAPLAQPETLRFAWTDRGAVAQVESPSGIIFAPQGRTRFEGTCGLMRVGRPDPRGRIEFSVRVRRPGRPDVVRWRRVMDGRRVGDAPSRVHFIVSLNARVGETLVLATRELGATEAAASAVRAYWAELSFGAAGNGTAAAVSRAPAGPGRASR